MTERPAERAAGIRLTLDCPQCGQRGWIEWQSLERCLRCPACQCRFVIGRNGKACAETDLPQLHYLCPRCRQSGSLPAALGRRGALCAQCHLPLALGPDRQLHGTREAAQMHLAVSASRARTPAQREMERSAKRTGVDTAQLTRLRRAGTMLTVLLAGVASIVAATQERRDSVTRAARQFTRACLTDRELAAAEFIADDAVQRVEFERWWTRYFPSIQDAFRPGGDRVELRIEPVGEPLSETTVLTVTLCSTFFGTRSQTQVWGREDGQWRFDARRTLATPPNP